MTPDELKAGLAHFYGSETIYRHPVFGVRFTEGVKYLADEAGAWWLVEAIMSYQLQAKQRRAPFQVWTLTLDKHGSGAGLVCSDGNGKKLGHYSFGFTTFPLPEIVLWLENNTLMLPSER